MSVRLIQDVIFSYSKVLLWMWKKHRNVDTHTHTHTHIHTHTLQKKLFVSERFRISLDGLTQSDVCWDSSIAMKGVLSDKDAPCVSLCFIPFDFSALIPRTTTSSSHIKATYWFLLLCPVKIHQRATERKNNTMSKMHFHTERLHIHKQTST